METMNDQHFYKYYDNIGDNGVNKTNVAVQPSKSSANDTTMMEKSNGERLEYKSSSVSTRTTWNPLSLESVRNSTAHYSSEITSPDPSSFTASTQKYPHSTVRADNVFLQRNVSSTSGNQTYDKETGFERADIESSGVSLLSPDLKNSSFSEMFYKKANETTVPSTNFTSSQLSQQNWSDVDSQPAFKTSTDFNASNFDSDTIIGNDFLSYQNTSLNLINNDTDDFDDFLYDYSNADTSLPLDEIVPVSMVYGSTLVVGVIGNLLVIAAVARDRRLRSITNIFLASLASADLALLCFCVPVKCVAFFSFSWAFGFFLCKSVHYFQIVAMVCSVMTLTVMSIERNIAILSPLRSKRICTRSRARFVVVVLWASSIVLALPILAGQKHKQVGVLRKAHWCVKEWDKPVYGILFESYMLVLLFMVPVGVMVVSYTTICMELSRGTKFRRQATRTQSTTTYRGYVKHKARYSSTKQLSHKGRCLDNVLRNRHKERMDKEKMKVIRMLIVVVVLFAICWGPILINNLLVSLGMLDKLHVGHLKPLRQAMFVLSYLNSSLNPLVYGFMSRHFRRGFREAICVCCSANGRRGRDMRLNRGWRPTNNVGYCYTSEGHMSTMRSGTIRLSPVSEQCRVAGEEELDESPVGTKRYGRKVWAKSDNLARTS